MHHLIYNFLQCANQTHGVKRHQNAQVSGVILPMVDQNSLESAYFTKAPASVFSTSSHKWCETGRCTFSLKLSNVFLELTAILVIFKKELDVMSMINVSIT